MASPKPNVQPSEYIDSHPQKIEAIKLFEELLKLLERDKEQYEKLREDLNDEIEATRVSDPEEYDNEVNAAMFEKVKEGITVAGVYLDQVWQFLESLAEMSETCEAEREYAYGKKETLKEFHKELTK